MFNWIILDHTETPSEVLASGVSKSDAEARSDASTWVREHTEDDYNDEFDPVTGMTGMSECQLVVREI